MVTRSEEAASAPEVVEAAAEGRGSTSLVLGEAEQAGPRIARLRPRRQRADRGPQPQPLADPQGPVRAGVPGGPAQLDPPHLAGVDLLGDAAAADHVPGLDHQRGQPGPGQARATLKGHSSRVNSVAFSPDGSLLAVGVQNVIVLADGATGTDDADDSAKPAAPDRSALLTFWAVPSLIA